MMLTRALLLLLVMMTGFSTAQAAETVRPIGSTASLSAALAHTRIVTAELAEKRNICHFVCINRIDQFVTETANAGLASTREVPLAPRTYLADRARE